MNRPAYGAVLLYGMWYVRVRCKDGTGTMGGMVLVSFLLLDYNNNTRESFKGRSTEDFC